MFIRFLIPFYAIANYVAVVNPPLCVSRRLAGAAP